ncbi:hypothetical protein HID58_074039, partial [Brassica napus]
RRRLADPIFNAWTRVAILTVEGTRVTRPTRLHRFLTPPAIQPSDPPANSELHRFPERINRRGEISSTTVKQFDPKINPRMQQHPFRDEAGDARLWKPSPPPEAKADDAETEKAFPPRRQKTGGDGSVRASASRICYSKHSNFYLKRTRAPAAARTLTRRPTAEPRLSITFSLFSLKGAVFVCYRREFIYKIL